MSGEFDFIAHVRTQQHIAGPVVLAAGDDLAILKLFELDATLVGIDQVLDGVHFDSSIHPPELIGRKAMNRNLSDIAAMAALPTAALVSLALPAGTTLDYAKRLYAGLKDAGNAFDCAIVGGDTGTWASASTGRLAVTVVILGRSAGVTPVRRSGARVDDHVYVTGPLGGSIAGRHLTFVPRIREARALATRYKITSMIDLSDGLSRDLAHLCIESGVGAVIDASLVPIHIDAVAMKGRSPIERALSDGEDYELCFTGEPGIAEAICVGRVIAGDGVWIETDGRREPMMAKAFEHAIG